jgi:hypothetical protein
LESDPLCLSSSSEALHFVHHSQPIHTFRQNELEGVFSLPEFVSATGTKLSGFLYCDNAEDKDSCVQFVQKYVDRAMPLVGKTLKANANDVCSDILGGC